MVKNPHYWEAGKPRLDGVTVEILPEDNSRVLKLKAGELDAIIGIPFNQVDGLKSDPNVAVGVVNAFRTDLVQLNTTKKPFDDVRVRQALNYAVDKGPIVQNILRGNGSIANSPLPLMAHHNADLKPYPYDVDKAKALLAAAGLPERLQDQHARRRRRRDGAPGGGGAAVVAEAGRRRGRAAEHRVELAVRHHQGRQLRDVAEPRLQRHDRSRTS